MRKRIEQLKQQHPAVRTRYAILFAGSVTGIIAFVWISTLPVRFAGSVSDAPADGGVAAAIGAFGETINPQTQDTQAQTVDGIEVVPNPTDTTSSSDSANSLESTIGN